MSEQNNDLRTADAVVGTSAGVSAVSMGAPVAGAKVAAGMIGGKAAGAGVALAAKSATVLAVVSPAAPFILGGAAIYGAWRLLSE